MAVICLTAMFFSCHKEGVFNPRWKINHIAGSWKIYKNGEITGHSDPQNMEGWSWKGNALEGINHSWGVEYFTYDKNKRLIQIEAVSGDREIVKFFYKNGHVSNIEYYINNEKVQDVEVKHRNSKVYQVIIKNDSALLRKNGNGHLNILKGLVPNMLYRQIPQSAIEIPDIQSDYAVSSASKEIPNSLDIVVTFKWDRDNVSEMRVEDENGVQVATLEYDNCLNPFYNKPDRTMDYKTFSKNNVLKITLKNARGEIETTNFEYTYDGNRTESMKYREPMGGGYMKEWSYKYEYYDISHSMPA